MLERFVTGPINELLHGKTTNYDFSISKESLPVYLETAGLYSRKDLRVDVIVKGGEIYESEDFGKIYLHPDCVRLRISTTERFGKTELKQGFFGEVERIKELVEEGKWLISIETQRKVMDALGTPEYNG